MTPSWQQWLTLVVITVVANIAADTAGCARSQGAAAPERCNANNPPRDTCEALLRIDRKLDLLLEVKREQLDTLREIARLTRERAP